VLHESEAERGELLVGLTRRLPMTRLARRGNESQLAVRLDVVAADRERHVGAGSQPLDELRRGGERRAEQQPARMEGHWLPCGNQRTDRAYLQSPPKRHDELVEVL